MQDARVRRVAVLIGLCLAEVVGCQLATPPDRAQRSVDRPAPRGASNPAPDTEGDGPQSGDPGQRETGGDLPRRPIPEHTRWSECAELPPRDPTTPADSVRVVDWCTRRYGAMADLRDGYYELHEYAELGGPHDTTIWKLDDVAYGDINGDGREDAAILIVYESHGANGGSFGGATLNVLTVRDGAVVELATAAAPSSERPTLTITAGTIALAYEGDGKRCRGSWAWSDGVLSAVEPICR